MIRFPWLLSGFGIYGLEVGHAGDIYPFEWQLTVANSSALVLGTDADSVKALYVTSAGQQNGITSEDVGLTQGVPTTTSVIPEPSSLLLLGTGLVGAAAAVRRRIVTAAGS